MFIFFGALWLMAVIKSSLFWLYFVQLKEYRLDRMAAHFLTSAGKQLAVNLTIVNAVGILLIYAIWQMPAIATLIIFWYAIKAAGTLYRPLQIPALTQKTMILIAALVGVQISILIYAYILSDLPAEASAQAGTFVGFAIPLIGADILMPLITLTIVFALKPLNIILRKIAFAQAKNKRKKLKKLQVIGIVGSYGKTTTKEIIAKILDKKFKIIKTPEHVNSEIGIANFLLKNVSKKHEIFICEMGAYKKGEIKTICKFLKPNIGVFVGANEQHLALFGNMQNLLRGEGGEELLESLPQDGFAIFNSKNKYSAELYKKADIPKVLTGEVKNMRIEPQGTSFTIGSINIETKLLGAMNTENILLAIEVGKRLGLDLKDIKTAIAEIKPFPRTMELKRGKNELNIIDSTYSANPSGVLAHLDYLKSWSDTKKVVVMPCIIELGSAAEDSHLEIGAKLAEVADLAIITTSDYFADILEGAGNKKDKIFNINNPKEAVERIFSETKSGDVVLLEGRISEKITKELCQSQ
ncbi:MAG: UDP-N-acetylmuramoyl-tripeptide--D-alanyl-D-alanine ligase [Candidatus Colwellbacteria bacterium]|nr:UDP-N-acetylmuramoyl-tripeptide--D-alanyl-D-alanine ligase [Candidatus Colwellbacteria bacterium]